MKTAELAGYLPPAVLISGGTWLLHKRAGLPVWQALASVLLCSALGSAGACDQLAALASHAARRIADRRPPRRYRWAAWATAAGAAVTVTCYVLGDRSAAWAAAAAVAVLAASRFACGATPASHRAPHNPAVAAEESE